MKASEPASIKIIITITIIIVYVDHFVPEATLPPFRGNAFSLQGGGDNNKRGKALAGNGIAYRDK